MATNYINNTKPKKYLAAILCVQTYLYMYVLCELVS